MYRFARCQPHPKIPDLQGWYLILEPDDLDALMKLHKGIANLYYAKFGMDPHYNKPDLASLYNPVRLAAMWLQSMEKFLAAGTTLAVNFCGGMVPLDSVKVLAEIESELMNWPDHYDDEVITISRWPEAKHYYLSSNKDRVFVPSKYTKSKDAHRHAEKYTDNIRVKENSGPLPAFQ